MCLSIFYHQISSISLIMKVNQLFRKYITEDILLLLLRAFNLKGLHDKTKFKSSDLTENQTPIKMNNIKYKLSEFYIPCKARTYLCDFDNNRCLTILRQVLRLYDYQLTSEQKYLNGRKKTVYSITNSNDKNKIKSINVKHGKIRMDWIK